MTINIRELKRESKQKAKQYKVKKKSEKRAVLRFLKDNKGLGFTQEELFGHGFGSKHENPYIKGPRYRITGLSSLNAPISSREVDDETYYYYSFWPSPWGTLTLTIIWIAGFSLFMIIRGLL